MAAATVAGHAESVIRTKWLSWPKSLIVVKENIATVACGGDNICIFEETPLLGGSLDGAGSPERGYVIRGGRMYTYEAYTCTFDLLSFIPSLTAPGKSIKDEIYEFNEKVVSRSKARLVRNGEKVDVSNMGFSNKDRLDLLKIMAISGLSLGAKRIFERSGQDVSYFAQSLHQQNAQPEDNRNARAKCSIAPRAVRGNAAGKDVSDFAQTPHKQKRSLTTIEAPK